MTIWALFGVVNEYYQPEHNLERWWSLKPNVHDVIECLGASRDKEAYKAARLIISGQTVRYDDTDYRLQQIEEGVELI